MSGDDEIIIRSKVKQIVEKAKTHKVSIALVVAALIALTALVSALVL